MAGFLLPRVTFCIMNLLLSLEFRSLCHVGFLPPTQVRSLPPLLPMAIMVVGFEIFLNPTIPPSYLLSMTSLTCPTKSGPSIVAAVATELTITGSASSLDPLGLKDFYPPIGRSSARKSARRLSMRSRLEEKNLAFQARFLSLLGHQAAFLPLRMPHPGFLP
jgi:hypothetical protein